jgi:hypothetical protein
MTTSTEPRFLGAYDFDGDPDALLAGYDRLVAQFPEGMILFQACIRRSDGVTVYDACPDEATFADFSTSDGFAQAIADAGLPAPRVTRLGHVHRAVLEP